MYNKITHVLLIILTVTLNVKSTECFCQHSGSIKKPVVGMALSGGGAKGLAYIGMLQVIDSIGIPIQYIGGTSMGSIIGGFTAIGYSPEYLKNLALKSDWMYLLGNRTDERYSPSNEVRLRTDYLITLPLDDKFKVKIPGGILSGQRVNDLFTRLYSPYYRVTDFSKLPTPFLCVAVDLQTGKPVEFDSGYFPDALLASMSIPIALIPKSINDRLYIDGGMVNNFPVSNLKKRGVETIIGMDVQRGLSEIDSINTMIEVLHQIMDINRHKSNEIGYKESTILLHPDISGLNVASFENSDTIIERGRRAALEQLPRLTAIADSLKKLGYKPFKPLNTQPLDSVYLESYEFVGLKNTDEEYVRNNFMFNIPGYVKLDDIEHTLEILRASYMFKTVIYQLKPCETGAILVLKFDEMSLNTVSFGVIYFKYRYVTLLLNSTFRNIGNRPSMLSVDLGISLYPFIKVDYIHHNDRLLKPGVLLFLYSTPAFFHDSVNSKCSFINSNLSLYEKRDFPNRSYIMASLQYESFKEIMPVGNDALKEHFNYFSAAINYNINRLDNMIFPQKGIFFDAETKFVFYNVQDYTHPFVFSNFDMIFSFTPITKNIKLSFNSHFTAGISFVNSLPVPYRYYLGGKDQLTTFNVVHFDGLNMMGKSGDDVLSFTETAQCEIFADNFLSFSSGIASITDKNDMNNLLVNSTYQVFFGVSYGIKTPILPIKISFCKSINRSDFIVDFELGYYIK